jgi:hypothetical protein
LIEARNPRDLSALVPWTEDELICIGCGLDFIAERPIGTDYRKAKCIACGARNADLKREVPWLQRAIH